MLRKYPKTFHLPWSPGTTSDDRLLEDTKHFEGREVVVTEKLDGENTSLYCNHFHARSLDSRHHESRNWVKALWGQVKWQIPATMRICGENMFAEHSIRYENLTSFFYVFGIYEELETDDYCLSWDQTKHWCDHLYLKTVPVLYRGMWNEEAVKACMTGVSKFGDKQEGYVVRVTDKFKYDEFSKSVAKYVRKNHIQTDEHWLKHWKPNKMKGEQ